MKAGPEPYRSQPHARHDFWVNLGEATLCALLIVGAFLTVLAFHGALR